MTSATRYAVPAYLRPAYADWLGHRPWDLFLTLTSEKRTHPEALHKRFRYCVHKIADTVYGKHWQRRGERGPEYVLGMERHRSGWPHSHALIRLPNVHLDDRGHFSLEYWQRFISDTGGFCHLTRPRAQQDVVSYTVKYVLKEGDLILSGNLNPTEAHGQIALDIRPIKNL